LHLDLSRLRPIFECMNTPLRAAIYLRVSTDEQTESGLGLASQEDRCRALASAKGWTVAGLYREEGVSGTLDPKARPEAGRLLADAAGGLLDVVLVFKLDRWTRRAEIVHRTLRELDERGVGFVSVSEPVDTASAMGRAFVGIAGVFAELERNLISDRTRAALAVKRQRGERLGAPKMGVRIVNGQAIEDADESATLARIAALRAQGLTLHEIAERLTAEGRRTKRAGKWAPMTVARALRQAAA
jgi:site-specific DNA recombinase